jgi:hypothetical protein
MSGDDDCGAAQLPRRFDRLNSQGRKLLEEYSVVGDWPKGLETGVDSGRVAKHGDGASHAEAQA